MLRIKPTETVDVGSLAGQKLLAFLRSRRLSQAALGALIGKTGVSISRYISGEREPRRTTKRAISELTCGAIALADWYAAPAPLSAGRAGGARAGELSRGHPAPRGAASVPSVSLSDAAAKRQARVEASRKAAAVRKRMAKARGRVA